MKPTIILGAPHHFGLDQRIKQNLQFHGFEVILLPINHKKAKLSLGQSLWHFYHKLFKNDRSVKQKIQQQASEKAQMKLLEGLKGVDYCFFIRPDMYSQALIEKSAAMAKKSVAYQWDGLTRYPVDRPVMDLFDSFYVFDENDLQQFPNCKASTNFYFDDINTDVEVKYDVAFVGTLMKERLGLLRKTLNYFKQEAISYDIHLMGKSSKMPKLEVKKYFFGIDFKLNLHIIQSCKAILDFQNPRHTGLSLRVFESVGYAKKLISTNPLVKDLDFYHPNNIFVLDEHNILELKTFLEQPYQPCPDEIRLKYSFGNWIKEKLA